LGSVAAALAKMERGVDPRPAGDCCSLALGRIQAVLDLAFAASDPRRKKMHYQGIARVDHSHGCRESYLGCATDSRRIEDAWLRYFGTICAALDEESAQES
jgi:hypothetical protein